MLNLLDDFPIHQTPEPIAHPATSDRNVYDRTWFNGYTPDGSAYFGIGMAVYPHRGILDCAFSVVERGGRQHCFYGSRRAPNERTEMQVGPFRLEILEPMRRARVTLDDNESGVACELEFSARTAPIQEGRQVLWQGSRRAMDATRFAQFGRWQGSIRHPDGDVTVDSFVGTKDRSWGVRGIGEPETGGAPKQPRGICFVWAPLVWEDHVSHAIFFDGPQGEWLHREGLTAPLYDSTDSLPGEESGIVHMASAAHRIRYYRGTRLASAAEVDLLDLQGGRRTIHLEPLLTFQMKGLGYLHPEWGQGFWKGELATGGESFRSRDLDPLRPEHVHVQQVVRATDGERTGTGVLEQIVLGPHTPSGLTGALDGAAEGPDRPQD
ncbi:MAG: hypothetical protein AAGK22_05220 [Acidobacteriota bacterium]